MKYDIEAAADELMLTTDEIKEVFECYFEDAEELITSCYTANREGNYIIVAKKIHALKGSSMNLRMHDIAEMVVELEALAEQHKGTEVDQYLTGIEEKIVKLKTEIETYYRQKN